MLDVVDPETLFRDYIYNTGASSSLVEHFRRYADELIARFGLSPGSLAVDIGSNDGTFLRFLKAKGLRVLGIDPAEAVAARATASGVETVPAFFTSTLGRELRSRHGAAALVTANNVFAHSDHLADMADGVRELLSPDGVFVFEVSYLVDIIDKRLFDTVFHEHLCFHSIKPLTAFLARHGLELFDVTRIPSKGGSLRAFAQRTGAARGVAPVVGELVQLESMMGLDRPAIFAEYTGTLEATKRDLHELLGSIKASGATVAGFGASATVTTLIYHFELGPFLDYLVDDNEARHGLYSPGLHLPVRPSSMLHDEKPDAVVVLAWQYADPIMAKHRAYVEQGGTFVVPLPEVKVVRS
jgi:SAM-dependent methyltransferase